VFPLLLWCCAKKHFRIATVVVVLCILSFLDNLYCMPDHTVNFYNPLARAWELLSGAALCIFMRRTASNGWYLKLDALTAGIIYDTEQENDGRSLGLVLALLGVILLGCALYLVRDGKPYPGLQALLPVAGTMCLIAAGSSNFVSRHLLANRLAVFTGLVSYPFYLWHWALISYAFIINGGLDASTRLLRVGLVAVSFVLAVLTYLLVEKPIRFGAWARTGKIYALIVGMVMVGAAGASVNLLDGLPERENFTRLAAIAKQLEIPIMTDEAGFAYTGIKYAQRSGDTFYCRYTDVNAEETVAVIGDSFSLAAYWGIAKLGRTLGWNTVLLGWFAPAAETLPQTFVKNNQENVRIFFDVMRVKKDITKVFIFFRGEGRIRELVKHHGIQGYDLFKKSLQVYVDRLREYGKDVFVVATNPILPVRPGAYVIRPFAPHKQKFPSVPKVDQLKLLEDFHRILTEIKNATIIDTLGPLCPDGNCLGFTADGLPMYWDNRHLSYAGSEFQAEHILRPYLVRKKE